MATPLFGKWVLDPSLSAFAPERPDSGMEYWALVCPCGGHVLRVSGRPRATRGSGSYFWRSVARVWREARAQTEEGELRESPFMVPLWLRCERCSRESSILDCRAAPNDGQSEHADGWGQAARSLREPEPADRDQPREAFRCRACRRGGVDLVVGVCGLGAPSDLGDVGDESVRPPLAAEVVVRCRACEHQARIAWFDERPSEQEVRLDLLYGRR